MDDRALRRLDAQAAILIRRAYQEGMTDSHEAALDAVSPDGEGRPAPGPRGEAAEQAPAALSIEQLEQVRRALPQLRTVFGSRADASGWNACVRQIDSVFWRLKREAEGG